MNEVNFLGLCLDKSKWNGVIWGLPAEDPLLSPENISLSNAKPFTAKEGTVSEGTRGSTASLIKGQDHI